MFRSEKEKSVANQKSNNSSRTGCRSPEADGVSSSTPRRIFTSRGGVIPSSESARVSSSTTSEDNRIVLKYFAGGESGNFQSPPPPATRPSVWVTVSARRERNSGRAERSRCRRRHRSTRVARGGGWGRPGQARPGQQRCAALREGGERERVTASVPASYSPLSSSFCLSRPRGVSLLLRASEPESESASEAETRVVVVVEEEEAE
ncbi:hypothetical protein MARPO_0051s0091 [Marchantia polymorpha]|uniref:Uncharacterized protein n=1 Tax=Marchantia polymorpha TaxID=3197 RepID=A0A2R6WXA5_MARPO|nr:hypothetical protein MARPO_0051s0091 [Marchantia polymorpha]|eukprot:PTQ38491.1 hypothetical protein MARPO_0051s0091 [Marchantia polymorpha]